MILYGFSKALRARPKITYYFGIPASGYLCPILILKTIEIACYSCDFAQSDRPNLTQIWAPILPSYFCASPCSTLRPLFKTLHAGVSSFNLSSTPMLILQTGRPRFFQQRYKTLRIGCQERKYNNIWWVGTISLSAYIFEECLEIDTPVAKWYLTKRHGNWY